MTLRALHEAATAQKLASLETKNGKRKEVIIDEITEEGHLARSLADGATYAATDRVQTARGLRAVEVTYSKSLRSLPEREKKGLTN
ncbi:MAG: hypothetical protein VX350_07300, partial [Pseudomonadota bacterium]|nr:hypothetical protein [Pseudomonadota bacterium]